MAPQIIIDATKSHLQCLGPLTEWVFSLKHLLPGWQGPYTHKTGSCYHHITEDVEDYADDFEYPVYGLEALMDDGESLDGLEKH